MPFKGCLLCFLLIVIKRSFETLNLLYWKKMIITIKINKQKYHLKWTWVAGRENSHSAVTQRTLLTPTGRDLPCVSDRKWHYFTTSAGGRKKWLLAPYQLSQWEPAITQPMESHYIWDFQFVPMDFFITEPLQIHKRLFFCFVSLDLHMVCSQITHAELQFFVPKYTLLAGEISGWLLQANIKKVTLCVKER